MGMEEIVKQAANPDYATPALYFFSTVAQTMGAIIAIVLTGVFAIIPQIQQKKDTPNTRLLIRFMKKDSAFTNAVSFGFTTICGSIISLLIMYISGQLQIMSLTLLIVVGIPVFIFGILSCYNIWIFVSKNISLFNNLLYLYEPFTVGNPFVPLKKLLNENNILDYSELLILINTELPDPISFNPKSTLVSSAIRSPINKHITLDNLINSLYKNLVYTKNYSCPNNENYFVNIFNSLFFLYQDCRISQKHKSNLLYLNLLHNIFEKCLGVDSKRINELVISRYYNTKVIIIDTISNNGLPIFLASMLSELVIYLDYNNYDEGIVITNLLLQFDTYVNMSKLNKKEKSKIFNCCSLVMVNIILSSFRLINENKYYDISQLVIALTFVSKYNNKITDNLINYYYYKYQKEQIILNHLLDKKIPKPFYVLHSQNDRHRIKELNFNDFSNVFTFINSNQAIQNLFCKTLSITNIIEALGKNQNWKNIEKFSTHYSLFVEGY